MNNELIQEILEDLKEAFVTMRASNLSIEDALGKTRIFELKKAIISLKNIVPNIDCDDVKAEIIQLVDSLYLKNISELEFIDIINSKVNA